MSAIVLSAVLSGGATTPSDGAPPPTRFAGEPADFPAKLRAEYSDWLKSSPYAAPPATLRYQSAEPAVSKAASGVTRLHFIPLILAGGNPVQSFLRIVNESDSPERIQIIMVNEAGIPERQASVDVPGRATRHVNGDHLSGLAHRHYVQVEITGREVPGSDFFGWAETSQHINIYSYSRSPSGFISDLASFALPTYAYNDAGELFGYQTYLPTINPASNTAIPGLVSILNIEIEGEHQFTLYGIDDSGAFTEPLTCFMPANTRATFTIFELEGGTTGCIGPPWQKNVGGKWAVLIVSDAFHISQGGMLSLQTGILANVSDGLSPQF